MKSDEAYIEYKRGVLNNLQPKFQVAAERIIGQWVFRVKLRESATETIPVALGDEG